MLRAVPCPQDPCVPSCHSSIQLQLFPVPCHQLQRELTPSKGFVDKSHCRVYDLSSFLSSTLCTRGEKAAFPALSSRTSAAEKEMGGAEKREKQYRVHQGFGDHHGGVTGAHTYFYADEAKCDQHMETFLRCIDASSGSSEEGFSAIKLTALARPQFLVRFSEVLVKWRRFFHQMAAEEGQAGRAVLDTKLQVEKLQEALANLGIASKAESQQWFTGENLSTSGTVDLLDWNSLFDSRTKLSRPLLIPNRKTGQLEPLLSRFSKDEELQMKRVLQRMDVLARRAMEKGVRLMVDAEQSYFQPAISRLTVETQRRFNRSQPLIYNTYQCYLREAYNNVTGDVELSRREGWHFGSKLVRGAYMEQERERAAQMGYEDPINPTYEKTNEMYHRCLDYVLEEIKQRRKASVMVATHNEDTVKFTLRRMMELGIHPSDKKVCFGQLLGMCDQITFPLVSSASPASYASWQHLLREQLISLPCPGLHGWKRSSQAALPASREKEKLSLWKPKNRTKADISSHKAPAQRR
ncbi:proline dehydrogenase 1, mitochondrial isoform X5 [Agelaius tricolor]|uniref:proline dehydrogenase 1, mitochondrial isoform X5 n=2 Tax=Agelaius tricolor TaxID=9191 RepID=UPI0039F24C73